MKYYFNESIKASKIVNFDIIIIIFISNLMVLNL